MGNQEENKAKMLEQTQTLADKMSVGSSMAADIPTETLQDTEPVKVECKCCHCGCN